MRPIDADALKEKKVYSEERHEKVVPVAEIDWMPTVDAVPVVHGIWVHHKGGFSDHYDCTVCGKDIVLTKKWMYCPNCGARMDGEKNG